MDGTFVVLTLVFIATIINTGQIDAAPSMALWLTGCVFDVQ
jgi:hypothetical protein